MKVRALIKMLEEDGWELTRTRGSHRQYKHPHEAWAVTVPGKLRDDLHPKTTRPEGSGSGVYVARNAA